MSLFTFLVSFQIGGVAENGMSTEEMSDDFQGATEDTSIRSLSLLLTREPEIGFNNNEYNLVSNFNREESF